MPHRLSTFQFGCQENREKLITQDYNYTEILLGGGGGGGGGGSKIWGLDKPYVRWYTLHLLGREGGDAPLTPPPPPPPKYSPESE